MYYPDELVEEVLAANDIVDVVSSYVQLKRSGANYFGLCPFHNEKSPSFSVSKSKQIFHCFGCGTGGNVLTFLMKYENQTFQEALRQLSDRAGIALPEINYSAEAKKREEKKQQLFAVNKEAATYYYHLLRSDKGRTGLSYLQKRGLTDDMMKQFGLGYASGSSNDLIRHLKEKGFSDDLLIEAGLASFDEKQGLHDKFWNRVMFPIQDVSNRVIGFGGRVMGDAKPKYLNSPETPIFDKSRNLYGLNIAKRSRKNHFLLCEGYMDVIAMHMAGFTEAVASLGTSFTEGQASLLKRYVSGVILAYDSDQAGVTAALRNLEILRKAGVACKILDMTPYKDPDEFLQAEGKEAFEERIRQAENAFLFKIRMKEKEFNMEDPEERTAFYREMARNLCSFTDAVERENYAKALSSRYYIKEEQLLSMVASYDRAGGENIPARPVRQGTIRKQVQEEKWKRSVRHSEGLLLTALSVKPDWFARIEPFLSADDFEEGLPKEVAEAFLKALKEHTYEEEKFLSSLISMFDTAEEQEAVSALFQTEFENPQAEEEQQKKAFLDVACAVKRFSVERITEKAKEDPNLLLKLVEEKKALDTLSRLR
ncbi:MAG: DNA primase [Lachnospiraceae bacterium]|nr:DNA primase [Lachnospiraceae bacterium]